ncbi:MAG TPA: hypothetical protein VL576_01200 [Candidatus Paceibacterota bacterium]|jgi:hypothetical protein|nr:hypothetical protein [Candidatus Paceibacterota bacterium]
MDRKTLLLFGAIIVFVAVVYFRNNSSHSGPVVFTPGAEAVFSKWSSIPEATVSVDTLYAIKNLPHGGGLLFSIVADNQLQTLQSPLLSGGDIHRYSDWTAHGFTHDNYVLVHRGNEVHAVTVKHSFAKSLNSLSQAGWISDPDRDVVYQSEVSTNTANAAYLLDPSSSIENKKVEVTGYRVYGDKPYILRFHIKSVLTKMPPSFMDPNQTTSSVPGHEMNTKISKLKDLYLIRIPLLYKDEVMGLSGSGAYSIGKNGMTTDTLIGLQSQRLMVGYPDEDGNPVIKNAGIVIERVH